MKGAMPPATTEEMIAGARRVTKSRCETKENKSRIDGSGGVYVDLAALRLAVELSLRVGRIVVSEESNDSSDFLGLRDGDCVSS